MMESHSIGEAKRKAYQQIADATHPLRDLIDPGDVIDGATRWGDISDERLRLECIESAEVILSENQHQELNDLAFHIWRESLTRAPMEHLTFDSPGEAIEAGYWPHDMDKWEASDRLYELGIDECPRQAYNEAREVAMAAIIDAMHPRREPDPDNAV